MGDLRFDGRVAVITGAGAGLGKAYALLFASRGASVVVNDLGGGRHGDGKSSRAADSVVQEIKSKGGIAVADYNSVTEGEKIVETALSNFGRIDILVNNAGILRDKSFARISDTDWDLIHDVHLKGSFKTTRAAWPHFQKQEYGRVIMTSSNSGLYGNFGQANYSAAKMGLVGLANTLAIEGRKKNIHCNVIVPTAASRLTEDILPPDFFAELRPELIAPVVVWLCHESCSDTGAIIESAAGWAAKCQLVRAEGSALRLRLSDTVTPETVQNNWGPVSDMSNATAVSSIQEATGGLMQTLEKMKENENSSSKVLDESIYNISSQDCILYALGVGTGLQDETNLKYLYEGHEEFCALPSFICIPTTITIMNAELNSNIIPGKTIELSNILHGEEYVELYKPVPTSGSLRSRMAVADVLDKGKGAVILYDVDTFDETGDKVAYTQLATFVVGAGGFGGKRDSPKAKPAVEHPKRNPDITLKQQVDPNQAALYRLSGDLNPLHIDPSFAVVSGFPRPILHGLCSLGFSLRLVLSAYGQNNPSHCKAFKARFAKPVFPGETLKVDMWREGNRVHFQTSVSESGNVVISGAYMDLSKVTAPQRVALNPVAAVQLKSEEVFNTMKERMSANLEKAKAVNGVFLWNVMKDGKMEGQWTLDLKKGDIYKGEPPKGVKVDTTLTINDDDMAEMAIGKLNPQSAFMKGKLKIKGNIMLTQKLKSLISAEAKL